MTNPRRVAEKAIRFMKKLDLSQNRIANKAKCSPSTVTRILAPTDTYYVSEGLARRFVEARERVISERLKIITSERNLVMVGACHRNGAIAVDDSVKAKVGEIGTILLKEAANFMSVDGLPNGLSGVVMTSEDAKRGAIIITIDSNVKGDDRIRVLAHELRAAGTQLLDGLGGDAPPAPRSEYP